MKNVNVRTTCKNEQETSYIAGVERGTRKTTIQTLGKTSTSRNIVQFTANGFECQSFNKFYERKTVGENKSIR